MVRAARSRRRPFRRPPPHPGPLLPQGRRGGSPRPLIVRPPPPYRAVRPGRRDRAARVARSQASGASARRLREGKSRGGGQGEVGGKVLPMIKPSTHRARRLRRDATAAERLLWWALRNAALPVRVRRQHPIGRYIADFAVPARKLVIEIDGGQHVTAAPGRRPRAHAGGAGLARYPLLEQRRDGQPGRCARDHRRRNGKHPLLTPALSSPRGGEGVVRALSACVPPPPYRIGRGVTAAIRDCVPPPPFRAGGKGVAAPSQRASPLRPSGGRGSGGGGCQTQSAPQPSGRDEHPHLTPALSSPRGGEGDPRGGEGDPRGGEGDQATAQRPHRGGRQKKRRRGP